VSASDAEAGYFSAFMTTATFGLSRIEATPTKLVVDFVRASGPAYVDRFVIE
jgi:hypothetical protein